MLLVEFIGIVREMGLLMVFGRMYSRVLKQPWSLLNPRGEGRLIRAHFCVKIQGVKVACHELTMGCERSTSF